MFNLKQVTQPAEPVVSVTELKEYLRIDNNLEDVRLAVMEAAAVRQLENYLSLKFVTQDWDVFLNYWPQDARQKWWDGVREMAISEIVSPKKKIELPLGVGQQLLEFSTFSDEQEFPENPSDYIFDNAGVRCSVGLKLGGVWPTTILRVSNGIRFRVRVGYGSASSVPMEIKQAVKELVAHIYENRGDQNEMKVPAHIYTLVNHLRREKLGC